MFIDDDFVLVETENDNISFRSLKTCEQIRYELPSTTPPGSLSSSSSFSSSDYQSLDSEPPDSPPPPQARELTWLVNSLHDTIVVRQVLDCVGMIDLALRAQSSMGR